MKVNKKWTAGALVGACAIALGVYAVNGNTSASTLDEAVKKFDTVESGDLTVDYSLSSAMYGEYSVNIKGQFEQTTEQPAKEVTKDSTEATKDSEEEVKDSEEEVKDSEESEEAEESKTTDPSRLYDYHLEEDTKVYVDGQETNSSSNVYAIGNTLFDKVFLTGSEADGKFVYDSRDAGVVEYPVSTYLEINPLINSFDLDGVSVEKGKLHNGEKGHVFTLTPEQVATALQGDEGETGLGQNILGLVSETDVDEVVFGVNATTFSVEVVSNGETKETDEPTSTSSDKKETSTTGESKKEVIGHMVVTKKSNKVEIKAPTNKLDLDEFSALVELYYQQNSEETATDMVDEDTVYGDESNSEVTEEMTEEAVQKATEEAKQADEAKAGEQ